jgi:hypothetical protein
MVKTRSLPGMAPVGQETAPDRPPVLPEPAPPARKPWAWWAVGAAMVLSGFGAGILWARSGPSRDEVEARLRSAHTQAEALRVDSARAAALQDLEALKARLSAGAPPKEIAHDLDERLQTHGLK